MKALRIAFFFLGMFFLYVANAQLSKLIKPPLAKTDYDRFNNVYTYVMRETKVEGPGIDLKNRMKGKTGYIWARRTNASGKYDSLSLVYYYYAYNSTTQSASYFNKGKDFLLIVDGEKINLTCHQYYPKNFTTTDPDQMTPNGTIIKGNSYNDCSEEAWFNLSVEQYKKIAEAKEVKYQISNANGRLESAFPESLLKDMKLFYTEYVLANPAK